MWANQTVVFLLKGRTVPPPVRRLAVGSQQGPWGPVVPLLGSMGPYIYTDMGQSRHPSTLSRPVVHKQGSDRSPSEPHLLRREPTVL